MPDLVCTKNTKFMGRSFKKGMIFHTGSWYADQILEKHPEAFRYAGAGEKPGPLPPIGVESPESEQTDGQKD